jgi:hypothetical protein
VGLVYAVVEASSTSQNHRCLAEMQSLWRQLRATNPRARMVVTIVRPAWPARQLIDLYSNPPGADAAQIDSGYRMVVLDLDRSGRQAASRLAAGRWNGISAKGMRAFVELARPIGAARREADPGRLEPARVDEYAYLDAAAGQVKVSPPPVAWPFTDAEIQWADDQKTPPGDRDTDDGPGGDPATPPGPRSTGGDGS